MKWRELRSEINQLISDEEEVNWIELEYPQFRQLWMTRDDDGGVVILGYEK